MYMIDQKGIRQQSTGNQLTDARNISKLFLFRQHVTAQCINYRLNLNVFHFVHQWTKALHKHEQ